MNQFKDWKTNMDRFFGHEFWDDFDGMMKPPIPAVNIYQYDQELLCYVNIPGMDKPKNIDVLVDHTTLTLKGKISFNKRGGKQVKSEIPDGMFERTIDLPFPVRHDKIDATYQHGLLIIKLQRYITDATNQRPVQIRHLKEKE
ncbi:UNVERIFIED_CONTAM: Hsp20/alpha crystallin family protein [Halobacillus marinus]